MRRHIPSLPALSCFDAAARHQSYTRAAEELAMTQGAVSRQIATLEGFLGLTLFRRTRHGVMLTPAGAQYARQVRRQLDALERDTLDAMAFQGKGGAVQLAGVPTFTTRWLMPRLPALRAAHPELVLHIDICTRPFLFDDTTVDAALAAGTPAQMARWPGTRRTLLLPEDMVVVGSPAGLKQPGHLSPNDVAQHPLLQQSTRPDAWRNWFEAQGLNPAGAMAGPRYELFSMLALAAAQGQGLALVPRLLIEGELQRGELQIACPPLASDERHVYLITPDTRPDPPAVLQLRDWLLAQAAQATSATCA
jgi:DNA-binding transcriptional LysR family regulator